MTPAFHVLMPFKRTRRIGGIIMFILVIGSAGTIWTTSEFDIPKAINLAMLGTILLAFLGTEALPMLKPGLRSADGVAVSATGVAVTRHGRTTEWRWDEISELRLRSGLHPANLILGKFLSFRVPRDARRLAPGIRRSLSLGGGVVAIGNDYPGRPADLFRQMEYFRENAAAAAQHTTSATPEAMWSFRKDRKKPKLTQLLVAVGAPVIGMLIAMVIIGDLPDSIEGFLDSPGVLVGLGGAVSMLPMFVLMQLRYEAKQDNMLIMSGGGLHTRHKIERRHWLWSDIVDMQVKQSASRGKDGGVERIVSFTATHDGSAPGREAKDGEAAVPVSCSIEDNYQTPIAELARQARAWWEWSSETFGHGAVEPAPGRSTTASAQRAGAIAFRRQSGTMNGRSSLLDQVTPFIFLSPMLAYTLVTVWMQKAGIRLGLPWWLDLGGMAVLILGSMIAMIAVIQPGLNRLELTDEGLLHVRHGFKRRWAWHEIGAVDLRRLRTRWSAKQRSVITLEADAGGWTYGLLRWAFGIDNRRRAVIEDIYDSSLDEIAEALDARRRTSGRAPRQ